MTTSSRPNILVIQADQLTAKVLPMYGFDMEAIVSVHQMVSNAIILEPGARDSAGSEA